MLAISSRKSVPPSASSKRPTRSVLASVNAPLTWPNSSLSKTPSESPPVFTVTSGRAERGETRVQRLRHHALAGAVLAGDEHVGVGRSDARDHLQHRPHGGGFGDQLGEVGRARSARFSASSRWPRRSAWPSSICVLRMAEQARVVPGLLDEVARAAAHGLHRQVHAAPGGHDDHRQRGVERLDAVQQVEALLAGGGVARVVEVHQDDVEIARLHGLHDARRAK